MARPRKPSGRKGPIVLGDGQPRVAIIQFPADKAARELAMGQMFVRASQRNFLRETEAQPPYRPVTDLLQNAEDDLDFTVRTPRGLKLLEIAEFAPLAVYGHRFERVPRRLDPRTKSALLLELIHKKSQHQGGPNRLLLVYVTEAALWVDPLTTEIARRDLARDTPRFERVYFLSPHDLNSGTVSELHPGTPHPFLSDLDDDALAKKRPYFMDPDDIH